MSKIKIKTKGLAIRHFCAECAGSPLDVTLCTILSCDLWPHRIGEIKSKAYKKRVERAFSGKSFVLRETLALDLTKDDFLRPTKVSINKSCPFRQENKDVEAEEAR